MERAILARRIGQQISQIRVEAEEATLCNDKLGLLRVSAMLQDLVELTARLVEGDKECQ